MGADLYINSVYEKNVKENEHLFTDAVKKRNGLLRGTKAYAVAQKLVEKTYQQAYGKGYFRESYGGPGLMAAYDLSWWADISKLQDKKGIINEEGINKLLEMFKEEITFDQLSERMTSHFNEHYKDGKYYKTIEQYIGEPMAYYHKWVVKRRKDFIKFLKLALKTDGKIYASL